MILRDITLPVPVENILFDDVLLELAEKMATGESLRFWESSSVFIVLGRTGKVKEDVFVERARQDNVMILQRSSGGGTVVQGPGCLNFTVILSKDSDASVRDIRKSYRFILDKVITALKNKGVDCIFMPTSDLALAKGEKKFSGNAQRRGKEFIMHHGTILYRFNLEWIGKYLKFPHEVPEYRRGRDHLDFVANIPLAKDEIKRALQSAFSARKGDSRLSSVERGYLNKLKQDKRPDVIL